LIPQKTTASRPAMISGSAGFAEIRLDPDASALPERLEAPSHRNYISDTWAFDVLAVVRGSLALETGDGIRSLG
jgi:hypothetical protein